jgi:hypothetical protein
VNAAETPFQKYYEDWHGWIGINPITKAFFKRFIDGENIEVKERVSDSRLRGEFFNISTRLGFKIVIGFDRSGFMAMLSRPVGFVFAKPECGEEPMEMVADKKEVVEKDEPSVEKDEPGTKKEESNVPGVETDELAFVKHESAVMEEGSSVVENRAEFMDKIKL